MLCNLSEVSSKCEHKLAGQSQQSHREKKAELQDPINLLIGTTTRHNGSIWSYKTLTFMIYFKLCVTERYLLNVYNKIEQVNIRKNG